MGWVPRAIMPDSRDGKLLYMAVPMLADDLPFYVLDPGEPDDAPS